MNESPEGLQFDRAEPGRTSDEGTVEASPVALDCSDCGTKITDSYYEVNAQVVCAACHAKAREEV